ncbi:MAG TPA: sulfite exporter TauE/SafE family protein [Thermodesulfobacteriota bacterium]|nr:sulfite exporter TauE/SafE family protein [Thermodesulfobacteriota bacterium]
MDVLGLSIIFLASVIGASFGTLVGGTSLITIPVLIFLGLPPHTAIGTDRLGIAGLTTVGWYKFHQKGLINYPISLWMGVAAVIGSFLGASLVLEISTGLLRKIIAIATVGVLIIVIAQPRLGLEKKRRVIRGGRYGAGIFISFIIGIYGGFYGAMAGTFLLYVLLSVFDQTFLEGTATLKLTSLMMTTMAAVVFAGKGAIDYPMAGAMFLGCAVGSYIGAHYSDRIGNVWIKRLFILIVLIMVVKLLIP